jgi:hypothetical protein
MLSLYTTERCVIFGLPSSEIMKEYYSVSDTGYYRSRSSISVIPLLKPYYSGSVLSDMWLDLLVEQKQEKTYGFRHIINFVLARKLSRCDLTMSHLWLELLVELSQEISVVSAET